MTTLQIILAIAAGALWLLAIPIAYGHRLNDTAEPEWYAYTLWPLWFIIGALVTVSAGLWRFLCNVCRWLFTVGYHLGAR